ncbi:MAG: TMEM14 family protein [Verrucomicrobia bacterium]|jgi:uncharacterized membrane protein (UPF0136 family)|nr:TMEM14 family protein [Verrucomicrobiota bacterium]
MFVIFGIYLALLVAGGLMGYLKAGSKVSLISSLVAAAVIALCVFALGRNGLYAAMAVQVLLIAVFGARLAKTKKFMPAGLMIVVTVAALIAEWTALR